MTTHVRSYLYILIPFLLFFTALPAKTEEEIISPITLEMAKPLPPNTAANSQPTNTSKSSREDKDNSKKTKTTEDTENDDEIQYIEQPKKTDINSFDENADNFVNEQQAKSYKQQNGISGKVSGSKLNSNKDNSSKKAKNYNKPDLSSSAFANNKDEAAYIQK